MLASKLGYQTRSFAEAAQRLGVNLVIGSDRCHQLDDPWADGAVPLHFENPRDAAASLAKALQSRLGERKIGAILALGDRQTVTAAHLGRLLHLTYNSPESVENCHSKLRQRDVLKKADLPVPDFFSFSLTEPMDSVLRRVVFPCVIKPLRLAASQGVIRADNPSEFVAATERIARLLASPELRVTKEADLDRLLVEGYIPGREVALEGFLESGQLHVLALFDKPDPLEGPYFEESIYVTPSVLPIATQDQITECAAQCSHALGLSEGPVHAEFRVNHRGPWVLEIAPRPIGGLCSGVLRFGSEGIFLEELLIRKVLGMQGAGMQRESDAAGVMMIPVPRSGVLEQVEGLKDALAIAGICEIQITARLHDFIASWPEGSSYLGFIFARGKTPSFVETALRRAQAALRFKITSRLPVAHPVTGQTIS